MTRINKVEYRAIGCGGITEKDREDLLAAGWCDDGPRQLARYGIPQVEAVKQWEKITGSSQDEHCEYCGPSHFFDSFDQVPRYSHDCPSCIFLGTYTQEYDKNRYDLYWCLQAVGGPTVIARSGEDGPDYFSGMIFAENGSSAPLAEARKRAISLGLKV